MVHPMQCNGSGWALGRPVGSPGRTPTTSQKQLRGKNDKFCHGRQHKRPYTCTVKRGRRTTKEKKKEKRKVKKKKSKVNMSDRN